MWISLLCQCLGGPRIRDIRGSDFLQPCEVEALEEALRRAGASRKRKAEPLVVPACPRASPLDRAEGILETIATASEPHPEIEHDVDFSIGVGPKKALDTLVKAVPVGVERQAWLIKARVLALVGNCQRSMPSVRCGIRCWIGFSTHVLGPHHEICPPTLEGLLGWSRNFRCDRTFSNYCSYVRLGCEIGGFAIDVFSHPSLRRAKQAISKKGAFHARPKEFVRQEHIRQMLVLATDRPEYGNAALMFLITYIFLLRLPSECLPIVIGSGLYDEQAMLSWTDDSLTLVLKRRKNTDQPTTMVRTCWCSTCPITCPIHVAAAALKSFKTGDRPFSSFSPAKALSELRAMLAIIGISNAARYRTHDIRRGHARDMQANGRTLAEILLAGGWRSAAFLRYLDELALHDAAVLEAEL